MATGILTLDWRDGMPHFNFHRDKASQVKEGIVNDLGNTVQGWNLPSSQGNGNPPGFLTQTPASPYQQLAQPLPGNPAVWGQNPGQPAGYSIPNQPFQNQPFQNQPYPNQPYPNQPYPNQPYPNQPYPNQPFQNPAAPNGQYPQWPNQQGSYPQTGSGYPGNYRR